MRAGGDRYVVVAKNRENGEVQTKHFTRRVCADEYALEFDSKTYQVWVRVG